ncbi:MAG: cytochrome c oxidase subunit II [Bacteroidetes bacterium]|nr:cytochrome c oxidase subunit II [Bacteroidota bacterium]
MLNITPYASNFVEQVDWVFKLIIGISLFFLILITGLMVLFIIRYNRKRHPKATQMKDYLGLELTWITVPVILVIIMFIYGYGAYSPMTWVPKDAMKVKVIGRMWQWSFEYPGNKLSGELVLPLNKPVKLNLYSEDVIHGFFIPAFRVKQDVVPGKDNFIWFTPQRLGEYEIFCTAYCGLRHAYMGSKVRVLPEAEYQKWLEALTGSQNEPLGLQLLRKNGCLGCHSLDGTKLASVSFKGLFGKTEHVLTDGKEHEVLIDGEYIHTSIYEPDRDVVAGYPKGIMKSYKSLVTDQDINTITDYLKTIK